MSASRSVLILAIVAIGLGVVTRSDTHAGEPSKGSVSRYDQQFRPQVSFSPARNWMNDPNGLIYFDGVYHLFFQYNPYGSRWGHMSWGHATSRDLLHWKSLPVAIPDNPRFMIFSGSVVVDWHNTSGFAASGQGPPLVAIYTAQALPLGGLQSQALAYSTDGGMTWTNYRGNPVLDIGLKDFRDPKVFWYAPQHKWVMVVSRAADKQLSFYSSENLRTWTHTGDFGPAGDSDTPWECPDLLELPVENRPGESRWVLKVDSEATASGGGGQVFIGRFDGMTFTAVSKGSQALDLGQDYYSSASWSNLPASQAREVTLGWMDKWMYAMDAPTSPWRGAMAFPRTVSLRWQGGGYHLMQRPIAELARLRRAHWQLRGFTAPRGRTLLAVPGHGSAHEIRAWLRVGKQGRFNFTMGSDDGKQVGILYDAATHQLSVDRAGQYRFSPGFDSTHSALLSGAGEVVQVDMIVDRSSVEAFVNDGEMTVTELMFPTDGAYTVALQTQGSSIEKIDLWRLQSIWR